MYFYLINIEHLDLYLLFWDLKIFNYILSYKYWTSIFVLKFIL